MIVERLEITKNMRYEANPNGYKGRIRFSGEHGEIELALSHELSTKILAIVGQNAVDFAKDLATNLAADVFTAPALEAK